jgi:hypothetical protein
MKSLSLKPSLDCLNTLISLKLDIDLDTRISLKLDLDLDSLISLKLDLDLEALHLDH